MKSVGWLVALGYVSFVIACGGESKTDAKGAGGTDDTPAAGGPSSSGSSAGGGASIGLDTPLEDYPRAYTEALCQVAARCDPRVISFLGARGCVPSFEPALTDQVLGKLKASIEAGSVTYHPEALPTCLRDLTQASCDEANRDVPSCNAVFTGNLATGDACLNNVECEGRQCLLTDQCPGTCGAPAALGESCSDRGCNSGLECAAGVCVKGAKLGELCDQKTQCLGYGLCYADPASPSEPSRCIARGEIPLAQEGQACEIVREPICGDGLVCTQGEEGDSFGHCQAKVAAGRECTYSFPDACPADQYCRLATGFGDSPLIGVCTKAPALGEPCVHGDFFATRCASDQICDETSGRCILGKRLDEACAADEECFSGHCAANGVCATQLDCEATAERAM